MIYLALAMLAIAAGLGLLDGATTRIANAFRKAWDRLK